MAAHKGQKKKPFKRDGRTKEPEWQSWLCMVRRCYEKNWNDYKQWGARGISVCSQWRDDYQQFKRDMGPKPSPKHTLDRIDNARNYEPGNCRWATYQEQMANRSSARRVTFQGRTMCVAEWAREIGVKRATLVGRLDRMSVERALTMPLMKRAA